MASERTELENYITFEGSNSLLTRLRLMTTAQSVARYQFAAETSSKHSGTIIDAASGSGWGTNYLSLYTDSECVIGIDCNPSAIKRASEFFLRENLYFQQADLRDPRVFDSIRKTSNIASFETIEHVSREDAAVVLGNFRSVHDGEGKLIISTPNKNLFSPYHKEDAGPWNPYHLYEYDAPGFSGLLQSTGWNVDELYGQFFFDPNRYLAIIRAVRPFQRLNQRLGGRRDSQLVKMMVILPSILVATNAIDCDVHPLNPKQEPLFLIAVCSKQHF